MGRTCIKDHRPERSLGDERWANGCAQCEIERERVEIERLHGVVAKTNDRCDHLGMRLGEVIRERDALLAEAQLWEERARHLGWRDEHGA